jgi:outer membrane protein
MKKIILTAAAVFAFSFANAQDKKDSGMGFAKGDFYAAGTFSTRSVSGGGDSTNSLAPSFGYFISDKISLSAEFATEKMGDDKMSAFGAGAAYHFNAGNQFSSHIGLSLASGSGTISALDYKVTALSLGYGIKYFVSSHFALTANVAALNYTSVKPDLGDAVNTTELGLDLSNISLSLVYKF